MKDFKANLDEEIISKKKNPYENPRSEGHQTLKQKLLRGLSRYSMLIIVGLAALSITFLHFKGKYLLKVLEGTPLPTFFLEKMIAPKQVPDKTEVYEEVLKEEEKQLRQERSLHGKLIKPQWQVSYATGSTKTIARVEVQDTTTEKTKPSVHTDTGRFAKPLITQKRKKSKKKPRPNKSGSPGQKITVKKETDVDFFQPVKIANES